MEMEERVTALEEQGRKNDERLDRHSKRLHTLEDGFMKDAVEIASTKAQVEEIKKNVEALTEGQKQTNKRLAVIENNNDANFNKTFVFLKVLAVLTVVTLAVVCCKDTSAAKDIVKTAVPLVTNVVA